MCVLHTALNEKDIYYNNATIILIILMTAVRRLEEKKMKKPKCFSWVEEIY